MQAIVIFPIGGTGQNTDAEVQTHHRLSPSHINIIFSLQKFSMTRLSKHCGFCIYIFDNSKSKSMVRLVKAEKMVWSGLVFARKMIRKLGFYFSSGKTLDIDVIFLWRPSY